MLQFNCSGCGSDDEHIEFKEEEKQETNVKFDPDAMNEIIASFSSPVEMAATIQNSGVPFSTKYLINPEVTDNYTTSFKKALGLGFLSADLGYLNVYSKTSQILEYLVAIRKISEDLKVGQFFDFALLKRLATTAENIDSLLIMSVQSYQNMDEHLRNNQRSNLSALLVTGVWIESLYLITQVSKEVDNPELKDRIGEQKNILKNLLPILKLFQGKEYEQLVQYLEELDNVYDFVKISYEEGETETKTYIDSYGQEQTVICQGGQSVISMTNEELQEIITTTEKIRNKLIAL
ncbi:MAG: hypothetical protein MJ211_10655 [Bacteroidales bacterium]|nr:hypothetical protein [Bacteroidales bacterium]